MSSAAVAWTKSGIPRSHLPDSAEPVLSAVEGLHPGYTQHDRFVHEQPERSEGEESRSVPATLRFFVASLLRMTFRKTTWTDY